MNIIINFNSLESLNDYWMQSFNNIDNSVTLNPVDIRPSIHNGMLQLSYPNVVFSPKLINSLQNTDRQHCYIPLSKSNYRKVVHPDLPDSLYKRLYSVLKNNNYIVDAIGSYVVLIKEPLTQDIYDCFQVIHEENIKKTLDYLLDKLDSTEKDRDYYLEYIDSLNEKIKQLEDKLVKADEMLFNKSITTWY